MTIANHDAAAAVDCGNGGLRVSRSEKRHGVLALVPATRTLETIANHDAANPDATSSESLAVFVPDDAALALVPGRLQGPSGGRAAAPRQRLAQASPDPVLASSPRRETRLHSRRGQRDRTGERHQRRTAPRDLPERATWRRERRSRPPASHTGNVCAAISGVSVAPPKRRAGSPSGMTGCFYPPAPEVFEPKPPTMSKLLRRAR